MSLRSFYVPDVTAPQELTDIVNTLRTVFEIRYITQQAATSTLVVKAPRPILDAATVFLESLDSSRPQVMLDFQVFQVIKGGRRQMKGRVAGTSGGMSIELGFAYRQAPNGSMIGMVDVPGHERFVHTMVAGAKCPPPFPWAASTKCAFHPGGKNRTSMGERDVTLNTLTGWVAEGARFTLYE